MRTESAFRKKWLFFGAAGNLGGELGFPPDVSDGDGPEGDQIDSRDKFGKKRWQKFPVEAQQMNHHGGNAEIEDVIGG